MEKRIGSNVHVFLAGLTVTTVLEEKRYNARVTKSKEEFIKIMANLNLPYPRMIGTLVKKNSTGRFRLHIHEYKDESSVL